MLDDTASHVTNWSHPPEGQHQLQGSQGTCSQRPGKLAQPTSETALAPGPPGVCTQLTAGLHHFETLWTPQPAAPGSSPTHKLANTNSGTPQTLQPAMLGTCPTHQLSDIWGIWDPQANSHPLQNVALVTSGPALALGPLGAHSQQPCDLAPLTSSWQPPHKAGPGNHLTGLGASHAYQIAHSSQPAITGLTQAKQSVP